MRTRSNGPVCIVLVLFLFVAVSPVLAERDFLLEPRVGERAGGQSERDTAAVSCKPVNAFIGSFISFDSCTYEGHFYEWCVDFPIWGTLSGKQYYYTQSWMNREIDVPEGALGESWSFIAASAVVVFDTDKGKIFGQENDLWHAGAIETLEAVGFVHITGGTDRYEGATGTILLAGPTTPSGEVYLLTGQVCTPVAD